MYLTLLQQSIMNKKRAILGVLLFLVISFILPYIVVKIISSKSPDAGALILMALLLNVFISFPLVLIEMMITKGNKNPLKIIKKLEHKIKVSSKEIIKDKFEAPLFLLPMSVVGYFAAKALEKDDTYYILKSKLNNKEINVLVNKDVYEKTEEGQQIEVTEEVKERQYNLCWFEMALISKFQDYVIEEFSDYKLTNSF